MTRFVLLLPVLPLASAVLMCLLTAALGRAVVRIAVAMGTLTLALSGVLLGLKLAGLETDLASLGTSWGSLLFDPLGLVMVVLIAIISLVVRVYSVRYMVEQDGYIRFFVLLDLMVATLLVLVMAGDLITLLVAWHLVGVLLYFLLGHDMRSPSAHRYGFWTFMTYRLADAPLLVAAVLLFGAYDTWSLPDIYRQVEADPGGAATIWGLPLAEVVGGLVALAAFARSAQFLLHTWLPYSMEGPTPVSALMHAGIVNAGGFLINRFAPIFVHTEAVLNWIFLVGLVTAVTGSLLMLVQNDIKKQLGYSTMGQMGFMTMECGLGAFTLAIFHMIAHGFFKGTMFLHSGAAIGEARNHDGVPKDAMYTFVIEKQPQPPRYTWPVMATTIVILPLAVLGLAHWAVAPDVFAKQGAVILLFFGWVTGAQLMFNAHRTHTRNTWRLVVIVAASFVLVVVGYTLISHAFAVFLYPEGFIERLYEAARIDLTSLVVLSALLALVASAGWVSAHRASRHFAADRNAISRWRSSFFATLSREFYVVDLYDRFGRGLLRLSARLNAMLRWG